MVPRSQHTIEEQAYKSNTVNSKAIGRSLLCIVSGIGISLRYETEAQSWLSQSSSIHRFPVVVDKLRLNSKMKER